MCDNIWEPPTREQCMNSVPIACGILYDLVNKIVRDDHKMIVDSKKRTIKLAISQAYRAII